MTKVETVRIIHLEMWILFYIWCGKRFVICKFNWNQLKSCNLLTCHFIGYKSVIISVLIEPAPSKWQKVFHISFYICKWIFFAISTFDRINTFCLPSSSLSSMESAVVNGSVQLKFTKLSLTAVDLAKKLKQMMLSCNFFL